MPSMGIRCYGGRVNGDSTCLLRTGIVLGKGGGALSKMIPPFKMGLGGKVGSGNQWMSWIHIDDLVGIICFCMQHDNLKGGVNGTSPFPVVNSVFTKALGKILHRPTFIPMPQILVKVLLGQMGEELLLAGKKILPTKVLESGYKFQYPHLEDALSNII